MKSLLFSVPYTVSSSKLLKFLFLCLNLTSRHNFLFNLIHSVPEQIWIKGSYPSKWLPHGERGPLKKSKSRWIEILHGGSQFTLWFLKIKNFRITPKFFFALQYIKNWTKVVSWKKFFCSWKKNCWSEKKFEKKIC